MQRAERKPADDARHERLRHIVALLEEALRSLDEMEDHSPTAARLSEVIDELTDQLRSQDPSTLG